MKTVGFFNDKGGVGKTWLVYHLAWMYADLGLGVIAADFDPQANLSSMFLDDTKLGELWSESGPRRTVHGALRPLLDGTGDVSQPHLEVPTPGLQLLVGDLTLSTAEDEFSGQWPACLEENSHAVRVMSALWRILQLAASEMEAPLVLIDVGSDLGALNRAALIASDYVVIPLAPDMRSLQGVRNSGPTIQRWRKGWQERRDRNPDPGLAAPPGRMAPLGYVCMQHPFRLARPVGAYERWLERIPGMYATSVQESQLPVPDSIDSDPNCLAALKNLRSLMPMARAVRKPVFFLEPADGAIGGHATAVGASYKGFFGLASAIAERVGIGLPNHSLRHAR